MKPRTSLLILALLTTFSALTGVAIYFYLQRQAMIWEDDRQASIQADMIREHLTFSLAENIKAVSALAGVPSLRNVLRLAGEAEMAEAYMVLDHFRFSLGADACYVVDLEGRTVVSTHPSAPGVSGPAYSARPDFQKALTGLPDAQVYVHPGPNAQGIYYSCQVYDQDSGHATGVVAIKTSDQSFFHSVAMVPGVWLVTDPNGLVFASNRPDWLFRVVGGITPEKTLAIAEDGQFGQGPWESLDLKLDMDRSAVDPQGNRYRVYRRHVVDYPGWNVVYLRDQEPANRLVLESLWNTAWVAAPLLCLLFAAGALVLYRLADRDLAQRRQVEEALMESEARFRSIVENAHSGMLIADDQFRLVWINEEMSRLLDWPSHEILNRDFRDFLDASSREIVADNYVRRQRGEPAPGRYEFNVVRSSGEPRRVEISSAVIVDSSGRPRTIAQLRDVTETRQAEERLKESESKWRGILETMEEGYFEVDLGGTFTFVNDSLARILEYSREKLTGFNYRDYTSQEISRRIFEAFNQVFNTTVPRSDLEVPVRTLAGRIKHVAMSCSLSIDRDGRPRGFYGLVRDVTARRAAEEELRESEERYRTVLEANPDPMIVYDMEGRVVYLNPAFTEVFGWTLEERKGRNMSLFVPEETMVETREMIQMVRQGQRFSGVETKRYTKRGEAVPVSISGASYTDRNGRLWGSIINIRDVRTQKSLEAQLQQAQKMEAVGTLASGIAHDFNNLLQAMSGNVQLLIQRAGRDSDLLRYLNEVDQAVVRASDLVRRLLTFSRKVKPLLTPLDLGREIQATISLLERTIPKMIQIDLDMDQDLHPVFGDPGQIQQVLLNLASNAKDAMPEGGRLGILARNVLLSDDFCRLHADLEPGAFVQLVVQDTGVGMNEETLSHIFEPFFTTKEVGRGTGLGLSSIYGIMKSHRGFIQCHSRLGEGSRFDLYFPAGSSQVPQVSPGPPAENKTTAGQETILLVDDERAIRQVARDYLEECGYHILEADSGEAALAVFTQDPRRIDMVILDLGMPGMGGQRCLREILGIYPTARVVIASGYSTDGSVQESLALGARSFLGKPYRLSELLEKVRGVLGGDAAAQAAFPDST